MTETLVTTAENPQVGEGEATTARQGESQEAPAQETTTQEQAAEESAPEGAPEKYEAFKAPEGNEFDSAVIEAYSEIAKELNLSQDNAQKLLDKVAPVMQARQLEKVEAVKAEWEAAAKTDKEFGGDKLNDSLATAKKALDAYSSPEFKKFLGETGLGNHPEMIRLLVKAGQQISEDKFVGGKQAAQGEKLPPMQDFASRLYS